VLLAGPRSRDVVQHVHGVLGPPRLIAEANPELAAESLQTLGRPCAGALVLLDGGGEAVEQVGEPAAPALEFLPGRSRLCHGREGASAADNKGKRAHTVAQIAAEFGVTRPTIYRHLSKAAALSADPKPPEAGAPITAAGSPSTDRKPAPRRRPTKHQ